MDPVPASPWCMHRMHCVVVYVYQLSFMITMGTEFRLEVVDGRWHDWWCRIPPNWL